MKKVEMKKLVSKWNRKMGRASKESREAFNELMELNGKYGDGHKWCSVMKNYKGLIGTIYEMKAELLLFKYCEGNGKFEALTDFLLITDNFNL